MPSLKPVLFFDFDNTLTSSDVLDQVIEAFAPDEAWREWEQEWLEGRLTAKTCLRRQVESLRVSRDALLAYLLPIRIDPAFSAIVDWARARRIDVNIVSDSFLPLIRHILGNNGIEGVPVYANELEFSADRLLPSFPHSEPGCFRSANAKARHFGRYPDHFIVFAGDGRSDLDAALAAQLVFAKSTLARELESRSVAYRPFDTLEPVFECLQRELGRGRAGALRIA